MDEERKERIVRQYNRGIICEHERDQLLEGKIGEEVRCLECHPEEKNSK